jgi:hypothetical protein
MTITITNIASSFPKPILTPLADARTPPTYAKLRITQTELNGNATSIHSNLGDGLLGHLTLTIPTAKYLTLTNNTAFIIPLNVPGQPVRAANATGNQIAKANRRHLAMQTLF